MNTRQVIGQSLLMEKMDTLLSAGRIVHAYLFTGPKGSGKKTFSTLLAQTLLCTDPGDKPCHICHTCRQTDSGNHPDIIAIRPDKGKTGIGVDMIRSMQTDINIKPYQGNYKIYIVEQAHTMTEQAQNALLKTLEEPPGYALLLLLADNMAAMLPTVLSRCQQLRLLPMPRDEVAQIIQSKHDIPYAEAMVYAALSQGIPGRGLDFADSSEFKDKRASLLSGIQSSDLSTLDLWGPFSDSKDRVDELLDTFLLWFRDILILKETGDHSLVVNMDKISILKVKTESFTFSSLKDIIEIIEKSRRILKSNGNYQLTIENMLLRIQGGASCSL